DLPARSAATIGAGACVVRAHRAARRARLRHLLAASTTRAEVAFAARLARAAAGRAPHRRRIAREARRRAVVGARATAWAACLPSAAARVGPHDTATGRADAEIPSAHRGRIDAEAAHAAGADRRARRVLAARLARTAARGRGAVATDLTGRAHVLARCDARV